MHAFLFVGSTHNARVAEIKKRLDALSISQFDTIYLEPEQDKESIGIDAVRVLRNRLRYKPQFSKDKAGVLYNMHTLTIEAQNALLKLLEEPPSQTYLFGEIESEETLLPTISSRCEKIRLPEENTSSRSLPDMRHSLSQFINQTPGITLSHVSASIKDRTQAKQWVQDTLFECHLLLHETSEPKKQKQLIHLIRNLLSASQLLEVNVNPFLAVDNALMII